MDAFIVYPPPPDELKPAITRSRSRRETDRRTKKASAAPWRAVAIP